MSARLIISLLGSAALGALALLAASAAEPAAHETVAPSVVTAPTKDPSTYEPVAVRRSELWVPRYSIAAGMELDLELRFENEVTLGSQSGRRLHHSIAGPATLSVLKATHDRVEWHLRASKARISVRENGTDSIEDAQGLRRELARGVVVAMTSAGRPVGLRFAPDSARRYRSILRTLFDSLRFELQPASAWTAEEELPSGRAAVSYRWLMRGTGDLGRHRLLRQRRNAGRQPVIEGTAEAEFDEKLGFLVEASGSERVCLDMAPASVVSSTRWQLIARSWRTMDPSQSPAAAWDGPWSTPRGHEEARMRALADERSRFAVLVAGLPVERILARLEQAEESDDLGHSFKLLMWKLRLDPRAASRLGHLLCDEQMESRLLRFALQALARAGSPECQAELGRFLGDPQMSKERRRLAAQALFAVEKPLPRLVDQARELLVSTVRSEPETGRRLAVSAFLALGTLARKGEDTARVSLLDLEGFAKQHGLLRVWLHALGNCGATEVLPIAARHAKSSNPATRTAACHAVRRLPGAQSLPLLRKLAAEDPLPMLRAKAMDLLIGRVQEDELAGMSHTFWREQDASVRRAAIQALGDRAASPARHHLLAQLAASDPDPKNRQVAASLLD